MKLSNGFALDVLAGCVLVSPLVYVGWVAPMVLLWLGVGIAFLVASVWLGCRYGP